MGVCEGWLMEEYIVLLNSVSFLDSIESTQILLF